MQYISIDKVKQQLTDQLLEALTNVINTTVVPTPTQDEIIDDLINQATEEINSYLLGAYSTSDLETHFDITNELNSDYSAYFVKHCFIIVKYALTQRVWASRHDAVNSAYRDYLKTIMDLEKIQSGNIKIPYLENTLNPVESTGLDVVQSEDIVFTIGNNSRLDY